MLLHLMDVMIGRGGVVLFDIHCSGIMVSRLDVSTLYSAARGMSVSHSSMALRFDWRCCCILEVLQHRTVQRWLLWCSYATQWSGHLSRTVMACPGRIAMMGPILCCRRSCFSGQCAVFTRFTTTLDIPHNISTRLSFRVA